MMNVYNGNIRTDRHGLATVTLPDYFEALNGDFRYQLTVIGQFAQAIVARKIASNHFVIRTSKPNVEVSWQVTGIRHGRLCQSLPHTGGGGQRGLGNKVTICIRKFSDSQNRRAFPRRGRLCLFRNM
jgi:hypothetical protein